MALKIHSHVSHGHIDNRKPDLVTGRIWLYGRDEPLHLEFEGNCLRDMAGCLLTFKNRNVVDTVPNWINALDTSQCGTLGDMTASRRISPGTMRGNSSWENALSLEWFSPQCGRILLESSLYSLELTPHAWHMDDSQEQAQIMSNQYAMRDYVVNALKKTWKKPSPDELPATPFLPILKKGQSANFVMDLYVEVCEKYGNSQDGEVNRAYVMGWDHVLSAMAYTEETGESFFFSDLHDEDSCYGCDEITEDDEARICRGHPLYERIQRFAVQAHEWVKNFPVEIVETWRPQYRFLQGIYSIVEKLALVFIRISRGEHDPAKLIIPLNKSLECAEKVRKMFDEMDLPGKEFLRDEMLAEWKSIGKDLAKLRFKIERRR